MVGHTCAVRTVESRGTRWHQRTSPGKPPQPIWSKLNECPLDALSLVHCYWRQLECQQSCSRPRLILFLLFAAYSIYLFFVKTLPDAVLLRLKAYWQRSLSNWMQESKTRVAKYPDDNLSKINYGGVLQLETRDSNGGFPLPSHLPPNWILLNFHLW